MFAETLLQPIFSFLCNNMLSPLYNERELRQFIRGRACMSATAIQLSVILLNLQPSIIA